MADTIAKSLACQIESIQVCPGGIICISFLDSQFQKSPEEGGSISFGDICCQVACSAALVFLHSLLGVITIGLRRPEPYQRGQVPALDQWAWSFDGYSYCPHGA